jgi:iron complex outermembrane recepter protein
MTSTRNRRIARFTAVLLTSVLWPAVAQAQDAAPPAAEEQPVPADAAPADTAAGEAGSINDIVVTATRQSQSVSRVPISIAAYSKELMDQQGVRRVDDIARLTPGVQFGRNNFGIQTSISIRGIASNSGSSTTGIYIDDTPIQVRVIGNSSGNAYPAVFDLDRVEVLRGPQGTLFGTSSQGGTVRFISPSPNFDKLSVYSRAEVGITKNGAASYEAGAAAGAPIIEDKLAFRISASHRRDGGFVDRIPYPGGAGPEPAEKNSNFFETTVLRAALGFKPTEDITITPSVYYQNLRLNDTGAYWMLPSDEANADYVNGNGKKGTNTDWFVLPSLKIEADLGAVSLFSTTSYFHREEDGLYDYRVYSSNVFGYRGIDQFDLFRRGYDDLGTLYNRQRNFTQEIRLQSNSSTSWLNWVVGAFYTRNVQTAHQDIQTTEYWFEQLVGVSPEVAFGFPLYQGKYSYFDNFRTVDTQIAGFGEATAEIFDGFKLIAGIRYGQNKLDYHTDFEGPAQGGSGSFNGQQKQSPATPRFGVSWQVDPANLLYATAAKGNRIGGVNRSVPTNSEACRASLSALGLSQAPKTFNSDDLWSYEIGSKNRIGPARIAASAYLIKWKGTIRSVSVPNCGFSFFTNLGDATSKGFDLQLDVQPTAGLNLTALVGYNQATFDETFAFPGSATNVITKGYTLGGSPWTVTLQGQYDFAGPGGHDYYVRSDFTFRSRNSRYPSTTYDPSSPPTIYDPRLPLDPATYNLNLRAGVRMGIVDASVFVNNATNESPVLGVGHDSLRGQVFTADPVRPITGGLTVSVRY